MNVVATALPGLFQITPDVFDDARGTFIKSHHRDVFEKHRLDPRFVETYYSVSHLNVLRGLHFQTPPRDHAKLVYCVAGKILDAVVDLRAGSPTFGKHAAFELNAENRHAVYVPSGFAHGFYSLTEGAVTVCHMTAVHAPENDGGIRWDSAGIAWPGGKPILSARDEKMPPLETLKSPFRYQAASHG